MGKNHLTPQTETRRGKSIHRYIGENKMGGGGEEGGEAFCLWGQKYKLLSWTKLNCSLHINEQK